MLTFRDILGHKENLARLGASAAESRLARAYLFYGPEGVGKFSVARAFARAVNCVSGPAADCGSCSSCRRIDSGNHPDVHVIDEGYSEEIRIERVRELQQEIALRPYEAACKVFIVNDSHNLNDVAANALLKTLEDTPAQSMIILVTDKPRSLPGTIVSRCRRENFRALGREEFCSALTARGFDEDSLAYLAWSCEGRLGPALRNRERPLMREKNALIDAFLSGRVDESLTREEIRQGLSVLAAWFRDVYVTKLGAGQVINADRKADLGRCAAGYGFGDLERILRAISSSFAHLERNVNSKLLLANLQLSLKG